MKQWKTLTKISQVQKNDGVRMVAPTDSGKRWIYIVEKVTPGEIHLSCGEHYPSLKILLEEELGEGNYEFICLNSSEE
jgi:hypothetical protein